MEENINLKEDVLNFPPILGVDEVPPTHTNISWMISNITTDQGNDLLCTLYTDQ